MRVQRQINTFNLGFAVKMTPAAANSDKINMRLSQRLSGLYILYLMKIDYGLLISSQRITQELVSHLGSVGFPLMKKASR